MVKSSTCGTCRLFGTVDARLQRNIYCALQIFVQKKSVLAFLAVLTVCNSEKQSFVVYYFRHSTSFLRILPCKLAYLAVVMQFTDENFVE